MEKLKTFATIFILAFVLIFTFVSPTSSLFADPDYGELD